MSDGVQGRRQPALTWELPDGWADIEPPVPVIAAAMPHDSDERFAVNMQALALPSDGRALIEIRAAILTDYAASLTSGRLIDVDEAQLDECSALRVLATHVGQGGDELTIEQWIALVGPFQIVLTATAPTLDYHWHLDAFGDIAESVEIDV